MWLATALFVKSNLLQEHQMSEQNVTVEQLPNGKWACFLHLPNHPDPIFLGREFRSEDAAENWLTVTESDTAIAMMARRFQK